MGFKDVDWAYGLDLPSGQKVVLAALCHRTDDKTHQTFVGRKVLAEMVGMTDRGISKILSALDEAGVISREKRRRPDGYRTTDEITINVAYTESQVNEVQGNQGHENEDQGNDVPISGEQGSDLRGTTFEARESKDSLVTHGSTNDHSSAPVARDLMQDFEKAWANWPKKVEKKASIKAFLRAAKILDVDELVADIIRHGNAYAATREKQFVPALCVWLAGERWTDELPTAGAQQRRQNSLAVIEHFKALEAESNGAFPPGHIPTDAEWAQLTSDPSPQRPSTMSPRIEDCGDHVWLLDGTCTRCEVRRDRQTLGAA